MTHFEGGPARHRWKWAIQGDLCAAHLKTAALTALRGAPVADDQPRDRFHRATVRAWRVTNITSSVFEERQILSCTRKRSLVVNCSRKKRMQGPKGYFNDRGS